MRQNTARYVTGNGGGNCLMHAHAGLGGKYSGLLRPHLAGCPTKAKPERPLTQRVSSHEHGPRDQDRVSGAPAEFHHRAVTNRPPTTGYR